MMPEPWGLGYTSRGNSNAIRWAQSAPAALGAVLLFLAWLAVRDSNIRDIWRRFCIWVTPLLLAPPLLSKDVWAYLEQGWIVYQGYNPYEIRLSSIGGRFGEYVDSFWQFTTTVYPPLALQIQGGVVALADGHLFLGLFLMRIPGLLSVVVVGAVLPQIARRLGVSEPRALTWALLNPLVLMHFIGGAHNDAWGVALGLVGLWVAVKYPKIWWVGGLSIGLAMAVKQPLGLWLLPVAIVGIATDGEPKQAWRSIWKQALARIGIGLVGVVVGFGIPTLIAGWGIGWATGTGSPQKAGSQSLANALAGIFHLLTGTSMPTSKAIINPIVLAIGLAVITWLAWKFAATKPVTFGAWALIAFALAYPSLQPWYLLWGGVALGLVELAPPIKRWVIGAVAAYLTTSVLLEPAAWPIPVALAVAIGVCVLVARTRISETDE